MVAYWHYDKVSNHCPHCFEGLKNKVDIEQVGDFENVDDVRFATYRITVSRSDESFSAEIEDIECDELGLPTEQSQAKMEEAVTKIKDMLNRLQS